MDYAKPEILLCPPGDTPVSRAVRKHIKDFHARLYLHRSSGVLMLKVICNRPVVYEKGDMHDEHEENLQLKLIKWGEGMTCVFRRKRNHLSIGPYRCLLEFVHQARNNHDSLAAYLDKNIPSVYRGLKPSGVLDLVQMAHLRSLVTPWNVWMHQKLANSSSIYSGVNIHSGMPVAIKTLRTQDLFPNRWRIAQQLRMGLGSRFNPDRGVIGVFDAWCDHNKPSPCCFSPSATASPPDECRYTYFSMPLAAYNFLEFPWAENDASIRLSCMHQTLLGLGELHKLGLAHEDLQPESLLVLGGNAGHAKAVISLSVKYPARDLLGSTGVCVAPELWNTKNEDMIHLNAVKLDVWAMAASWLYAFLRPPSEFRVEITDDYEYIQQQLDVLGKDIPLPEPLINLLREMLAWDPQDRPTDHGRGARERRLAACPHGKAENGRGEAAEAQGQDATG
ncbi:hypothetical protein ACQKWADRAFT_300972 [Trichoderma austrokoningii]